MYEGYGTSESMFGDDGSLPPGYGQSVPGASAAPGSVVGFAPAHPQGVPQVPGTVIGAGPRHPQGVPQIPGTVVSSLPASNPYAPPQRQGRGGIDVSNGLPPLPTGVPMQPGGHYINAARANMPLPGRPVRAPPYPSDVERYQISDGNRSPWGATAEKPRDIYSLNYAKDQLVYRFHPDASIEIFRAGKSTARITAQSSPSAYAAILAEVKHKRKVDPALLAAGINAAALVGTALVRAHHPAHPKKHGKPKFDASTEALPAAEPVSAGVPTWVWIAGGAVAVVGIGLVVFNASGRSEKTSKAA